MQKPVAAFDVDGTLYRSNFTVELVQQLVRQGSFPAHVDTELEDTRLRWKTSRDRMTYLQYIEQVIALYVKNIQGLTVSEVQTAAKQVVKYSQGMLYVFGKGIIKDVSKTHVAIAISGSPIEVVTPFVQQLGIEHVHATTFEILDGLYTGNVVHIGTREKDRTLKDFVKKEGLTFKGSLGMGDTDSDLPMLTLLEKPIAFNPNKETFEHALQKGWEIVYEQKDMILHLGKRGKFQLEGNFGHYRQNGK